MRTRFRSVDSALRSLLRMLLESGRPIAPRGLPTLEATNVGFTIADPRARLVTSKARSWSLPLAIGEFFWHLAGERDAAFIGHYASRWSSFASHGVIPSSCYGYKMFRESLGESQWEAVKRTLGSDTDSRRAVISLLTFEEDLETSLDDVSCATTLQFFIRENKLHLTASMRSNDVIWGMCYDIFTFTMLQEWMARQLGIETGEYYHFVGSLHVYERHYQLAQRIIAERPPSLVAMPAMPGTTKKRKILDYERHLRQDGTLLDFGDVGQYWTDLLLVLSANQAMRKGKLEIAKSAREQITQRAYRRLLVP